MKFQTYFLVFQFPVSSCKVFLFYREDADLAAARAVIFEPDAAVDFGEDRVVLAESGIQSGEEPPPALAYDDRSASDHIAVMALDAQPLRVAVAAVA